MKPWMKEKDIEFFKEELLKLEPNGLEILEWGSGGSTIHYPSFLIKNKIQFNWTSIEYNKVWHSEMTKKLKDLNISNTTIILFDVGNNNLQQPYTNMDEYVNYPSTLNKKFDLILVDGRKRRRCLIEASKLLKDNGVVLLHDAQRSWYHSAFKYFNGGFLSEELWKGNNIKNIDVEQETDIQE